MHQARSAKDKRLRVLICGDRNYTNKAAIDKFINSLPRDAVIIEGEAAGADTLAATSAKQHGHTVIPFPAKWAKYGRAAGPIRNKQMLDVGKPDVVVAFHDNIDSSKGTSNMLKQASKQGIKTQLIAEKYLKIKHDDSRYRHAQLTSVEIARLSPASRKDYFNWAYSIRREKTDWLPPLDPDDPFLTWNPPYLVHRVPKTENVHTLLETKTVAASGGDACFSETVTAHVPYFGAMFEFDKQKMIDKGVKPLWYSPHGYSGLETVPTQVQKYYSGELYMFQGGSINRKEYEWNHPHPMKIELSDIKAIWVPMYHQKDLHAIREDVKRHGLRIPVGTVSSRPYYRRYNEDLNVHTIESALTETQWEQRNLSRFVNLGVLPKSALSIT